MKNRKTVKNVFYQASEFVELVESKYYSKKDNFSKIPIYINCLFACELFLKAILLADGINVKVLKSKQHHLCDLYLMLNDKRKEDINNWMQVFHLTNIIELLDKINNDYIDVRYMYIDGHPNKEIIDMHSLSQFMYKLQNDLGRELFGYDYYLKKKQEKLSSKT